MQDLCPGRWTSKCADSAAKAIADARIGNIEISTPRYDFVKQKAAFDGTTSPGSCPRKAALTARLPAMASLLRASHREHTLLELTNTPEMTSLLGVSHHFHKLLEVDHTIAVAVDFFQKLCHGINSSYIRYVFTLEYMLQFVLRNLSIAIAVKQSEG